MMYPAIILAHGVDGGWRRVDVRVAKGNPTLQTRYGDAHGSEAIGFGIQWDHPPPGKRRAETRAATRCDLRCLILPMTE
jgi:hypothetical protein